MAAQENARRRTATAPATVDAFLARHADHFSLVPTSTSTGDDSASATTVNAPGTGGRVQCTITGHEMPARLEVLQEHLRSKKYLLATATLALTAAALPAHIVASEQHPDKVYCNLTGRLLNKTAKQIEDHVNGRRYKKALAHWERTGEYPHQTRARLAQAKRDQEKAGDADEDGEFWKPDDDGEEGEEGEEDGEDAEEEEDDDDDDHSDDDEDAKGSEEEEDAEGSEEEEDAEGSEEEEGADKAEEKALSAKGVSQAAGQRPAPTKQPRPRDVGDGRGVAATEARGLGPFFKNAPVQSGKKVRSHNTSAGPAAAASVPGSRDHAKRPRDDEPVSRNEKRGRRA